MSSESEPCVLISREEIAVAVKKLAAEISRDYLGKYPLLVGILKGSFMFLADLIRHLDFPLEIEFVHVSSYSGTQSSGEVCQMQGLLSPIQGRDVLLVEDIVDTGLTTGVILDCLRQQMPASLKLCALTDKPARRRRPVTIDYLGFTVPNKFLVGYGLDLDEKYRNLPDICSLED